MEGAWPPKPCGVQSSRRCPAGRAHHRCRVRTFRSPPHTVSPPSPPHVGTGIGPPRASPRHGAKKEALGGRREEDGLELVAGRAGRREACRHRHPAVWGDAGGAERGQEGLGGRPPSMLPPTRREGRGGAGKWEGKRGARGGGEAGGGEERGGGTPPRRGEAWRGKRRNPCTCVRMCVARPGRKGGHRRDDDWPGRGLGSTTSPRCRPSSTARRRQGRRRGTSSPNLAAVPRAASAAAAAWTHRARLGREALMKARQARPCPGLQTQCNRTTQCLEASDSSTSHFLNSFLACGDVRWPPVPDACGSCACGEVSGRRSRSTWPRPRSPARDSSPWLD